MHDRTTSAAVSAVLLASLLSACGQAKAPATAVEGEGQVAAEIGTSKVTVAEVDARAAGSLARIEYERYQARRRALDEIVAERLLEEAARLRGVSKEALVKAEVDDKVKDPTEADVAATYERHKSQLGGLALADVADRIRTGLIQQDRSTLEAEFHSKIRATTVVKVLLPEPRADVKVPASAASIGPADAKVTIVEFLDYQCPFCHRAQESVDVVLKEYEGKVRFVHRDYLLGKPRSLAAARAARCAGEQGKFWELRMVLMRNAHLLSADYITKAAADLKLEMPAFAACRASSKFDAEIQAELQEGTTIGVSGTPTFVIGRTNDTAIEGPMVVGALPYPQFDAKLKSLLPAK